MKVGFFKRVNRRRVHLVRRRFFGPPLTAREQRLERRYNRIVDAACARGDRRALEQARARNRRLAGLEAQVDERIALRRAQKETGGG